MRRLQLHLVGDSKKRKPPFLGKQHRENAALAQQIIHAQQQIRYHQYNSIVFAEMANRLLERKADALGQEEESG